MASRGGRRLRERARMNAHRARLNEVAKAVRVELERGRDAGAHYGDTSSGYERAWQADEVELRMPQGSRRAGFRS